jgi:phosphopantothenoylcysteine decarboxylase/phosphopantothenate--cysteine ligase
MGFSLARLFRWYGAEVKVIAGFTTAKEPPEVEIIRVVSAEDMLKKVMDLKDWVDIIVMNAAVADYRPLEVYGGKMKKQERISLELVKNPDILKELGKVKGQRVLVGFALEEKERLRDEAIRKLREKNLDIIIANPLESMGSEAYEGLMVFKDGKVVEIKAQSKLEAGERIVSNILKIIEANG